MPIDLQAPAPFGQSVYRPSYRDTPLFDGYRNLQRSLNAPYHDDYINKATSFSPFGSIRGGPTLAQAIDIVRPDPKRWTTIAPPRAIAGNILGDLGAKPSSSSKLGSFSLNMIAPFESLHDATHKNIGLPEQGGDASLFGAQGPRVFGVAPIDVLNWQGELPIKLMERPLALAQTIANRIAGGGPMQLDADQNAVYPFQKDPAYWQWLRTATDQQLTQQARAVANSSMAYGRNEALFNSLMDRFRTDRDVSSGLSSGSDTVDYTAKKRVQADLAQYQNWQRLNSAIAQSAFPQNAERDPGFATWLSSGLGRSFIAAQTLDPNHRHADDFGDLLNALPLVGTRAASFLAGPTDEAKAAWASLLQTERQRYLSDAGFTTIVTGLVTALPLFGGIGALGMAAQGSKIATIAQMGRVWSVTLKAANVSMALGLGVTTAAWAVENYAPYADARAFGRDVNLVDPLSHSTLGGVLNTVGFFSSGTFGAALLIRSGAKLARGVDALGGGRIGGIVGTPELPYYGDVFGGSPTLEALHRYAGVERTSSELAVKRSLLSFSVNAAVRDGEVTYRRAIAGEPIGIEAIDNLEPEARIRWAADQLAHTYAAQPALIAQLVERFGRARVRDPLLATDETIGLQTNRAIVRNMVDTASREHVSQYGSEFFGSDRATIRARVQANLTALGYQPDMAGFDHEFGTADNVRTVQRWQQLGRAVHQLEYSVRDAELHEHLKVEAGTHEQGATLFSQRTLSVQDITEALPVLRGADAAAARAMTVRLINTKLRVAELVALGETGDPVSPIDGATVDPVRLAEHLEAVLRQNGAPRFRDLPDPASPTADLPLNAFHRQLVEEGLWQIGFRAREFIPAAESFGEALAGELSAREMQMAEPTAFILRDVAPGTVPDGYVQLPAGTRIKRTNWYALDPIYSSDGRYFVRDDGSLNLVAGAGHSGASRPSNNPADPYPLDRYDVDFNALPDEQKILARGFNQPKSSIGLPPPWPSDLEATGQILRGRNPGAEWPVLRLLGSTDKYLFKAGRSSAGRVDLPAYRVLAGAAATRLLAYLGLHVPEETPFTWDGVKGTIQKLVDVVEVVDLGNLAKYSSDVINELVRQHIGDWFTSQHDSNSDSMLIGDDGFVTGIDKGQAYKYATTDDQAMLHEFWSYRSPDALDTHLGEYLERAVREHGVPLDRQAVEPLVQAIEDLPEDVYLASLKDLAEARVAQGLEASPREFYAGAIARKRAMREAVNRAFEQLGYAGIAERGATSSWKPQLQGRLDIGTPAWLNDRPLDLATLLADNAAHPVDEPNGDAVTKAGVVIEEPDGRVWLIEPKNNWAGYAHTWPKGNVDFAAGETFQAAAIREAFEETGMSVRLKAHLTDEPNDSGVVTRYYLAERVAGGPEHVGTPGEIGSVTLTDKPANFLFHNGVPDPRDTAVVDALRKHHLDAQAQTAVDGLDPGMPEETITADPAGEMGYTSHVRLANGSVWRTAWLDANVREAAQIELGNRGIAGRAYDSVFRGWRAWRILETQKAGLHFRLTRDFEMGPGAAEKIELLYTKLLEIQRKTKGGSIQAIAGVNEHLPFIGRYHDDVAAAAVSVFGEGPFLSRKTGKPVAIDFNRAIQDSFRQSLRLNVTAGFTSWLKTIPGLGDTVILPATDFIYPLLRFHLSPLFKGGEYVESGMLNAMRGVQYSGDPFIDALWWKSGAGAGLGVLAEEGGADMMLAGLSALSPTGSLRGRHADAGFFFEKGDAAEHAKAVAGELAPSSPFTPGAASSGLGDRLTGGGLDLPDPVKFPDTYSALTPRPLLKVAGVDATTAEPLLELAGGDHSRVQVQRVRDQIIGKLSLDLALSGEAATSIGSGFAFLASLPPGTIERLAENIPQVHTPTSYEDTSAQIDFVRQAIVGGFPAFSGRASTGHFSLVLEQAASGEGVVPSLSAASGSTTISPKEQWAGFADAKYGSTAAEYSAGNRGDMLVVLKPEKLRDSVTVGTDRINLENNVLALQDAMMTPAVVNSITRLQIQKAIVEWHVEHPDATFQEFLNQRLGTYFNATEPFEMAYMNGIGLEDISAVLLPESHVAEWSDLVAQYADHPGAKGLGDIKVIPTKGSARPELIAHWLDRAGLADLAGTKPEILSADEATLSVPAPSITLSNIGQAEYQISGAGASVGIYGETYLSNVDEINRTISQRRVTAHELASDLAREAITPAGYGHGATGNKTIELRDVSARIAELERLRADLREFYATGHFSGHREAAAAIGSGNPGLAAAAHGWLGEEAALAARMQALGVTLGNGEAKGIVRVVDRNTQEVLSEAPFDEQPPLEMTASYHGASAPSWDSTAPYSVIKARALLEAYQAKVPRGYSVDEPGIIPAAAAGPIAAAIDTPALRSAIRARAEAKLGETLTDPVIRSYIRGPVDRIPTQMAYGRRHIPAKGVDELVITVSDGSGQPYGTLTLPELTELWQQYGFPADFKAQSEAEGYQTDSAAGHDAFGGNMLLYGPGPTPEGRFYFHPSYEPAGGNFEQTPTGLEYVDPDPRVAFDGHLAYSFDPGGQSYITLEDGRAFFKSGARETPSPSGARRVAYERRGEPVAWSYAIADGAGAFKTVILTSNHNRADLVPMLRDVFDRTKPDGVVRLSLLTTDEVAAFEKLYKRGEVPDHIVAVDGAGEVLDAFRVVRDFAGDTIVDLLPAPPAADYTEIKGQPESILARNVEAFGEFGARGKRAVDAVMNPIPYKHVSMDRLTFHIARNTFAPVLRAENPRAAGVFAELKVPPKRWADFLLQDRALLSRWKETGARSDWEALVQHASHYTGKADYMATQKGLDELYASPDFAVMLETWRGVVKAAQDESYGVHFFSQYRSTFERTINHPIFGIYPASWAFKIAKEWFRFLYRNETLGFRAGMVPAAIIKQLTDAQAVAWAQANPEDLDQFWQKGPLSSSAFIFNLLLPGDWSSIPFPFSRSIRDVARGKTNPVDLFVNAMTSMGLGRDIRLGVESAGEVSHLVAGDAGQGRAFKGAWSVTDAEGLPQGPDRSPYAKAESVHDYYAWR